MITWLDVPFKGTNVKEGFEILIHGFVIMPDGLFAMCVDEDGKLHLLILGEVALDWRYTRGKGWHSIDDPEPAT